MKFTIGKLPGAEDFAVPPGLLEPEPEIEYRWRMDVYTTEKHSYEFIYKTEEEFAAEIAQIKEDIYGKEPIIEIGNTIFIINNISTITMRRQSRLGPDDYWESLPPRG